MAGDILNVDPFLCPACFRAMFVRVVYASVLTCLNNPETQKNFSP